MVSETITSHYEGMGEKQSLQNMKICRYLGFLSVELYNIIHQDVLERGEGEQLQITCESIGEVMH